VQKTSEFSFASDIDLHSTIGNDASAGTLRLADRLAEFCNSIQAKAA
jgi:hypothetical protein